MRALLNRWRRKLRSSIGRTIFGEQSQGRALPNTRISPSTIIEYEENLHVGDHVYIGPMNWIEASGGMTIGEGVQIISHCTIATHSSHRSQRLMGREYAAWTGPGDRPGWVKAPVVIGPYTFIGPHSVIEAGAVLGRGCLVRAGSVVRGTFPDFAVLDGRPAVIVGDTRDADARLVERHPGTGALRDAWAKDRVPPV